MFYELFEQKVLDKCQPAAVLTQRLGSANMFVSSPPAPRHPLLPSTLWCASFKGSPPPSRTFVAQRPLCRGIH